MTPSEVTKQDLEALVGKANELAKEIGLTYNLSLDDITVRPRYVAENREEIVQGKFSPENGKITITYNNNQFVIEKRAGTLLHETVHKKFEEEIMPYCKEKNSELVRAFNEGLGFAVDFFFDEKKYLPCLSHKDGLLTIFWPSPELSYAIARVCKNGMSMDEIFGKVKTYLSAPLREIEDTQGYPFSVEYARFIRNELGQNLDDIFQDKEELAYVKSELAKEAAQ
jgi:hypothetical protein